MLSIFSCSKDDDQNNSGVKPITNTDVSIDFIKTYGGNKNDSAKAITATFDGGYAILGYTQSMDGDVTDKKDESYDFFVMKFNASNALQWSRTYGGTGNDRGSDIIENEDGSLVVLGYSTSADGDTTVNAGAKDYWVLKLSASGTVIWEKSHGFLGSDVGISVIKSKNGGYLLTGVLDVTASEGGGNTRSGLKFNHAGGDYWAIKLSEEGELEWSKYFGGGLSDTPYDVVQTDDNGYIMVGSSDSPDIDISGNIGTYDFWVVKISSLGIMEWEKSYGGTEIDDAYSIIKAKDGDYMIAGTTRSNDQDVSLDKGLGDLWLIKISKSGDLISEKSFGGTDFDLAQKIINSKDGGYILSGASRSPDGDASENQGQNDGWVLKVDSNTNLKWQVSAGGSNIDFFYDVAELKDGSVIAVGDTYSSDGAIKENKGFSDLLTIKIKTVYP